MPNDISVHEGNTEKLQSRKARLVTAEAVAHELGFSSKWVYHAAKCLAMPHYRIGRRVRFDLDEVLEWVRAGRADIY